MNDKTLIGVGIAAVIFPAACFFYFAGSGAPAPSAPITPPAASKVASTTAPDSAPPSSVPAASTQPDIGPIPKLTDEQERVTPATIENLAKSVQLDGNDALARGNRKEVWARAIPMAQALVNHSDADCEEHNWLVRFVDCGKLALTDSPDYYSAANALQEMPRDQQEAQTGLPSQ